MAPVPAGMNAESDESLLKSMRDMAEGVWILLLLALRVVVCAHLWLLQVKKGLSSKLDMSSLVRLQSFLDRNSLLIWCSAGSS